jgi:hypothetical protein
MPRPLRSIHAKAVPSGAQRTKIVYCPKKGIPLFEIKSPFPNPEWRYDYDDRHWLTSIVVPEAEDVSATSSVLFFHGPEGSCQHEGLFRLIGGQGLIS